MESEAYLPLILSAIAGSGTLVGGLLLLLLDPASLPFAGLQSGCGGIMTAISFLLFYESGRHLSFLAVVSLALLGFLLMYLIERGVDSLLHPPSVDYESMQARSAAMSRLGWITFATMFLHNLPEGMSVALTTASDVSLGFTLGTAIFLHNILEGLVVSLPIWTQTRSAAQVVLWSTLNGLAEPLGVLLSWLLILDDPQAAERELLVHALLAIVGGLMLGLTCSELLPHAWKMSQTGDRVVRHLGVLAWFLAGFGGGGVVLLVTDAVSG
ncbi:hypothetical protein HDV03_000576 [Kappamyces sp. JEL0829]|nr:hypothetical protein HDV03_000576 [Kappamyces sp. JEL0829]